MFQWFQWFPSPPKKKKKRVSPPPAVAEAPLDGAHGVAAALGLRHGGGLPWAAAGGPGESHGEARAWWCLVGGWWGWWMVVDFWRVVEVTFSKISEADLLLDVGLDLSRRVIFRWYTAVLEVFFWVDFRNFREERWGCEIFRERYFFWRRNSI